KGRFNMSSTGVGRAKAKSRRNAGRKTVAKFLPAFSKAKRSERPLGFWCAIKMRGRRSTLRAQRNFGRRMLISPTRLNTGFEIGRVAVAPRHGKRLAALQLVR